MKERFTEEEIRKGFEFWENEYKADTEKYSDDPQNTYNPKGWTEMLLWCIQEATKKE